MGKELKTRFVAAVDGTDRELFSARQSAKGDLTVLLRGENGHALYEGGPWEPLVEQRFSVHRSDENAHGRTIKYTATTATGKTDTHATFVKNAKTGFLTRIFAELCPDLRLDRYAMKSKASDRIVRIAEGIPLDSTFIYHVYVSTLDRTPPDLINCRKHVVDFSLFRLCVYAVFSRTLTTAISLYCSFATAPRQIDGEAVPEDVDRVEGDGVEPLADNDVFAEVHTTNEDLAARQTIEAGKAEFAAYRMFAIL